VGGGGGGVIVLVVALGYLIWYMVALGCLICRKIKSSPVGGFGGVVVVVWWLFYRL
jgi:hypothetical protein